MVSSVIVPTQISAQRTGRSALVNKRLLKNAWRKVLTSGQPLYKNYMRAELESFGSASEALLDGIYGQLLNQNYEPQAAYRIYVPKGRFSSRTLTLIAIPDWIVYTAITTLILEAAIRSEADLYSQCVYSNVPLSKKSGRPPAFFQSWKRAYRRFNTTLKSYSQCGYPYLANIDLTAFYDLVDHSLLLKRIRQYFSDEYALDLLKTLWRRWASNDTGSTFGHGIPQGPEASAFLADLFLFELDRRMLQRIQSCKYARYVDDIRIFCCSEREAQAQIAWVEQQVKMMGLVPNSGKLGITDTRRTQDWLKEESSTALQLSADFPDFKKLAKDIQKAWHARAKEVFLGNCSNNPGSAKSTFLTKLALPRLFPDKEVTQRILENYGTREDLMDVFFMYFKKCGRSPKLTAFCWEELSKVPVRDWESANLIDLIRGRGRPPILSANQIDLLLRYAHNTAMPLASATATAALLSSNPPRNLRSFLRGLPRTAVCLAVWGPAALALRRANSRRTHPSVVATLKEYLAQEDSRLGLLSAYLLSTSRQNIGTTPRVGSSYAATLLLAHNQVSGSLCVDEISPMLKKTFRVKVPVGFDFRQTLSTLDPQLYQRALQHLRLAMRYYDTNPTRFINLLNNFNHILLHYALNSGQPGNRSVPFKHTFSNVVPGRNPQFEKHYPTICNVFRECADCRNTNLLSHPYNSKRTTFATWVTYKELRSLVAKLRAAYSEFMAKAQQV